MIDHVDISMGTLIMIGSILMFVFPGGIYVGRLSQKVDGLVDDHKIVLKELKEIRKLLTETVSNDES